jgi:U3 small nucleolar RNA-associated protein 12
MWPYAEGVAAEGGGTRRELGVAHVKTLQMAEDVLSVKVTPDGRLLSVSLLDNTLKAGCRFRTAAASSQ